MNATEALNLLAIQYCNILCTVDCNMFLHQNVNCFVLIISLKMANNNPNMQNTLENNQNYRVLLLCNYLEQI